MKRVFIYTNSPLYVTRTFVQEQARALRLFSPHFVGLIPSAHSLPVASDALYLQPERTLASRVRKEIYKLTGIAPSFHRRGRAVRASIVHTHFAEDAGAGLYFAKATRLPMIVTLHGLPDPLPYAFYRRTRMQAAYAMSKARVLRETSLFICVSDFIRSKAESAGYPAERLRVHYTGIDVDAFTPGNDDSKDRNLILFIGRFVEKKGTEYLLRAMQIVQRVHPSARLKLIGDGPLRQQLQSLALELKVACEFDGMQNMETVRQSLRRARVLCAPSVTAADGNTEGLPTVICEAESMGVPVVSTTHAGIPEAVKHEVTGLLAPERDFNVLSKHLLTYLTCDGLWEASRASATVWARERFSLAKQTAELERIYDEVIANRHDCL